MSVGTRIASMLLVAVVALLQVSVIFRIEIAHASPDVLILVVASIALLTGSISGAAHGFLAGVCFATFAAIPLGPHALIGTVVGYAVGRVGEALITDDHPIPPLVAGIFATATMQLGRPLVEFLVNPAMGHNDGLWVQALLVTIISSVLAVPTFLLVRRVLVSASAIDAMPGREAST